jgi:putative OPT family oligopeptide transporter
MAIVQLNPEQVREMTLEQKDEWWLKNVFRGDMPQLTLRAAITGMIIGGTLSMTNLYVGTKTGWTLGVGITSVILAFGFYKVLSALRLGHEFTILENNAMQSIATAAGYMTGPLISSISAYMMVTQTIPPRVVTICWIVSIATLGVLFAFPLKRRFINDEQLPFPEGRAAGIVMDALHTSDQRTGLLKAKLLVGLGAASAAFELLKAEKILASLHLKFLAIPEALAGVPLEQLTISLGPEHVMFAAGGLMGIRTGVSILIGSCINYFILAPLMIHAGDIVPKVVNGENVYGLKQITQWSLWPGVALMTTASLLGFFAKPKVLLSSFSGLFGGKRAISDAMRRIELPMPVFVIGIPAVGGVTVFLAHHFFGVSYLAGIIAVPLVFVFALIAVNSTGLTSITPIGAMGQLTQLTFAGLSRGQGPAAQMRTTLMTASITGEVSSNAANLLMDIKPGYMLGAKPRQQAIGHVLGILTGTCVAVPVFYALFLQNKISNLGTDNCPMPAALIWKGVAELLSGGVAGLPQTAVYAALIGAVLGITLEVVRMGTRGRFPLSPVGLGLGTVISWSICFAMFLGAFTFWLAEKIWRDANSRGNRIIVQNQEPICAGIIAGGSLMGILAKVIETFLLK